jgi:hypothetical protein
MNGRTATASGFMRMIVGWFVAAISYFVGYHLIGIWLAGVVTALFILQFVCISLYRHAERKKALAPVGQQRSVGLDKEKEVSR